MKTVVFITGTNCVGKSTVAWALINRFGGIGEEADCFTVCNDRRFGLVGRYDGKKYGGVDRLTNEKGSSCTSRLSEAVGLALDTCDVVLCEGSYMDTFGMNLTNALFLGDKALVVSLYAPPLVLYRRLKERSDGKHGVVKRDFERVFAKQRRAMSAAQKYQSIGVRVMQFDTSKTTAEKILENIIDYSLTK